MKTSILSAVLHESSTKLKIDKTLSRLNESSYFVFRLNESSYFVFRLSENSYFVFRLMKTPILSSEIHFSGLGKKERKKDHQTCPSNTLHS